VKERLFLFLLLVTVFYVVEFRQIILILTLEEGEKLKNLLVSNFREDIVFNVHTDECFKKYCKHCKRKDCKERTTGFVTRLNFDLERFTKEKIEKS